MTRPKLLSFGEVLWDLIDGQAFLGGAPFNLAAHAALCGLESFLLTRVGEDELGRRILAEMNRLGVNHSYVQQDLRHPTGTVTVELSAQGQPTYQIHRNVAWDFIDANAAVTASLEKENFQVLCFGTLSQREGPARESLRNVFRALPGVPAFFDVNLRQNFYSAALLREGLEKTAILKLNDSEVSSVSQLIFRRCFGEEEFAGAIQQEFPVRIVLVTLGEKGCWVREGSRAEICPGQPVEVADTVGAGDAFSAAFLAEWLNGKSVWDAAMAGNRRGAWVASQRGAIPEGK